MATSSLEQVFCNQEVVDAIVRVLGEDLRQTSPTPGKWKQHLVPLLAVSKNFFHASIDQLWESMDSFLPCIRLLPSVEEVPSPKTLIEALEGDIWIRFSIYSTRIRSLNITDDTESFSAWFTMIASHTSSLNALFPRLKHLFLRSTDALATLFLSKFAAQLVGCSIGPLDNDSKASNFTTTSLVELSLKANNIEEINVTAPVQVGAAAYFSKVQGLRRLILRLTTPMEPAELLFLNRIPALSALYLDNGGAHWERRLLSQQAQEIEGVTTRALKSQAQFPTLLWYGVRGDGLSQFDAARVLAPTSLQDVRLDVSLTGSDTVVLLPHVLRIYLERCKSSIQTITVTSDSGVRESAVPLDLLSSMDPLIHKTPEFLTALSNATQLSEIVIYKVPLFDNDIISKILDIIPNLPHLVRLIVRPTTLSDRDAMAYPTLASLDAISTRCPSLKYLNAPIDLANVPPLPQRSPRMPQLSVVCIGVGSKSGTQIAISQLIAVGRYLATAFPNLNVLEPIKNDDPEHVAFWRDLEDLVRSYHDNRARAIQELSVVPG